MQTFESKEVSTSSIGSYTCAMGMKCPLLVSSVVVPMLLVLCFLAIAEGLGSETKNTHCTTTVSQEAGLYNYRELMA